MRRELKQALLRRADDDMLLYHHALADVCEVVREIPLDEEIKDRFQLKLYRHLSLMTTGEAHLVVRSVETQKGIKCGFGALALLSQRFNPKTPGRIFQHWSLVLDPPRVKDVRLLQKAV